MMTREEIEAWKLESLARAVDWLSARAILKLDSDEVVFSGEDWREFRNSIESTFDAKAIEIERSPC
jgi:hypothetical protein